MSKEYDANVIETLMLGNISDLIVISQGSNGTYLTTVTMGMHSCNAIYKPREEEKPLWDFASGTLFKREYASYLLATALGWDIIPPTVIRNGPLGEGSLQLFLEVERESNYFTLSELHVGDFQTIAVFDYITNNADRKANHCLRDLHGKIWCIDHGLTFHHENKLRTVIWDFAEQTIPTQLLDHLSDFLDTLCSPSSINKALAPLLTPQEFTSLISRVSHILHTGQFPKLDRTRINIPWPWF